MSRLSLPTALLLATTLVLGLTPPASTEALTPSAKAVVNRAGQTFRVLSHRGGALQWPENSLEAFTGAAEAGYDGIETDISFTADGVAVMSHNDTLPARCTNAGSKLHTMTLQQVRQVRCQDLDGEFSVPIPTFDQLAAVLADHPGVGLSLDIKSYPGQSAAGRRSYAASSVRLLQRYGLLSRSRVICFSWATMLSTIRALAPHLYVAAYDYSGFNLDRVRLAAKLKASSYGTTSSYTSVTLAQYTRDKGMDSMPWNITAGQAEAMSIYYGPKTYWFITDAPAATAAHLASGTTMLDWAASDRVTVLPKPKTVSKKTYKAKKNYFPTIWGKSVPTSARTAFKTVNLSVRITKGPAKNYLYYAARSLGSTQKIALPKGTGTVKISVPVGNGGQLRLRTSKKSKLTITALSYTNQVYTAIKG